MKIAPAPAAPGETAGGQTPPTFESLRPSGNLRVFEGKGFSLSYPANWQIMGDQQANIITIAPAKGVLTNRGGDAQVGYGLIASYYFPQQSDLNLARDTEALLAQLRRQNPSVSILGRSEAVRINGQEALVTRTESTSPFQGEREADTIVTTLRPEGLYYLLLIAPNDEMERVKGVFEHIINSLRFNG